jgi:putative addiction module killer protein
MIELRQYLTGSGKNVFQTWFDALADDKAQARIAARLERLEWGNFGDCKPLNDGVWELRINWGPGYRVYYGMAGKTIVLLLCGGDKRKQSADIARAVEYFNDYKRRSNKQ